MITEDDHKDRLLFFSDIECIFYYLQNYYTFGKGELTITSKIKIFPDNEVLIEFDLIQTTNPLFSLPGSKTFPKVLKSASFSITPQDFKNSICLSLKTSGESYQLGDRVVEDLYKVMGFESKVIAKTKLIKTYSTNMLKLKIDDNIIKRFFDWIKCKVTKIPEDGKDIDVKFGLCGDIKNRIGGLMKSMLSNNLGKKYEVLTIQDQYSFRSEQNIGLVKWLYSIQTDIVSFVE